MPNWKEIVTSVAPAIGKALGGPLAGIAVKFVSERLLGKSDATEDDIEKEVANASTEQLKKLKEIDREFEIEMQKLNINVYELDCKDRVSAREMFKVNSTPQIRLSMIFVLGYFFVLFYLLRHPDALSGQNANLLGVFTTVLGVLTASIPQILNFWFGSSLGSKEKTQGLNFMAGKLK